MISKSRKFCLQRENFHPVNTALNRCHGIRTYSVESSELEYFKISHCIELLRNLNSSIQLPLSVPNGYKGYFSFSHQIELHFMIDYSVLMTNNVYDYFKSDDEYSVSFKASLPEIRYASLAVKFLQVQFTVINSLCS